MVDYNKGGARFASAEMWVIISESPLRWAEIGFMRSSWCPGNCFFRAAGDESIGFYDISRLPKATQGAFTWHVYRIAYDSSSGIWRNYIDGTAYGGWSNPSSAVRIDIGNEVTNNCTILHTTYFGSPSMSSPYAFQYRTSWGQWTTWGTGIQHADHPPYHNEWLTYAIYIRTWGP
ncbi:MAG: hypothetical protein QJR03_14295 [Sphaerobacter sp.]|nr:hypothetical protein [Sphaerobacter sp.]